VEHFYVKFGYPIVASIFEIWCGKPTNVQTPLKTLPRDCVGVGKYLHSSINVKAISYRLGIILSQDYIHFGPP